MNRLPAWARMLPRMRSTFLCILLPASHRTPRPGDQQCWLLRIQICTAATDQQTNVRARGSFRHI